jgi:acetyl-CoA carboxylase/biotin carboxylase 1
MHQLDPVLLSLDVEREQAAGPEEAKALARQIKEREALLLPLYMQIANEFADLHDRSGRMQAKG